MYRLASSFLSNLSRNWGRSTSDVPMTLTLHTASVEGASTKGKTMPHENKPEKIKPTFVVVADDDFECISWGPSADEAEIETFVFPDDLPENLLLSQEQSLAQTSEVSSRLETP